MRGLPSQLFSASRSVDALQQHFGSHRSPPVAPLDFNEESVRRSNELAKAMRPGADLSESERYALLSMSRQMLARMVAADIRGEDPVPPATVKDYFALASRGLAEVPAGQRYHVLTGPGFLLADQVSRWLAKDRGLHFIWDCNTGGYTVSTHCTCGWHRTFSRNEGYVEARRMRAVGNHLADVEEKRTKHINRKPARQRA